MWEAKNMTIQYIPIIVSLDVWCLGFVTGILQVRNFNTVPTPAYTVPISGMGTYHIILVTVSSERHLNELYQSNSFWPIYDPQAFSVFYLRQYSDEFI